MNLYIVCPVEKLLYINESEEWDLFSDMNLNVNTEKRIIPSYLDDYFVSNHKDYAKDFVSENCTNIYELGSYPFCAIVEFKNLGGLVPHDRSITLYQYNSSKDGYDFYHELTKDEALFCPPVSL